MKSKKKRTLKLETTLLLVLEDVSNLYFSITYELKVK